MRKLKLLLMAFALLGGASSVWATDYTSSLPAIGAKWDLSASTGPVQNTDVTNGDPKGQCVDMGTYKFAEVYNNSSSGTVFEIYKNIIVPNGTYIFQMAAFGRRANVWGENNPNTAVGINAEVFANAETTPVTSNTFVYYTVTTTVTDGSLKVGLRAKDGNEPNWWGYTDYTLLKVDGEHNVDLTKLLANHSFEGNNTTGWILGGGSSDTGARENSGNYATNGTDGSYLFNTWWQGVPITQTIAGMPNGKYTLTAALASSDPGDDAKLYMLAQGGHSDVITISKGTSGIFNDYNYTFDVDNNSVTVGVVGGNADGTYNEGGHWWYKADNFRLSYCDLSLKCDAVSFTSGNEATADTWYYYDIPTSGDYQFTLSSAGTFTYTTEGTQLISSATGTEESFTASQTKTFTLTAGRFYFKTNAASTISIILLLENGMNLTAMINNAAVTSTAGWTNGRTASGQQYTGAPDNTYMDVWNAQLSQSQDVTLPVGYYLLKCATRADATITTGPRINVYSYTSGENLNSIIIHHEGASGNLLGNGWGWTYVPFNVTSESTVRIEFWSDCSDSKWAGADDFHLTYYTSELEMKKGHLTEIVSDANVWAEKLTTTPLLEAQLSASVPACSTVEECNTAISSLTDAIAYGRVTSPVYPEFKRVLDGANDIKDVSYKEITSGCYNIFTSIISSTQASAENATDAATITTATNTLKSAIKNYIAGAEPANDGEYFDITCLMVNPNFDDSHNGWTYGENAPGVSWSNCEYYEKEFDINQTVTGLPTGSYSLSVQAFQRPGWAGNVYNDYVNGTDNASSVLYINSITSNVKNIAADAQDAPKLDKIEGKNYGDWPYDSQVGSEGYYKYVPNSQQGAKLYFDAGLYDATCAAVVDEAANGSLKLGFKSTKNHVTGDWTIFDNFRLYYYGSSLLIYYKQYLPQLKEEVSADLSNGAYANVLTSSEDEALDAALAANPESETEAAYKTVIDNLVAAQAAFRAAAPSYDAMVAAKAYPALTKISANIGEGIFQYNETTNNTLFSAYETAKSLVDSYTFATSSIAADAQEKVNALNTAISNYENQALNAPASDKRYWVSIVDDGQDWNGYAITFIAGGRNDQGNYAIKYLATANANLNQALKFIAVDGEPNTYKVSAINAETGAEQYLTTGSTYEGGNNSQIRTTDDADKASWVKIQATATNGQFKLLNVSDNNAVIARNATNPDNGVYTSGDANFTIAEASQASVGESEIASGDQWGTRIFPFAPNIPDGVTVYSCDGSTDNTLNLTEVGASDVKANTPYILFAESGCTIPAKTDWGVGSDLEVKKGLLTGIYKSKTADDDVYVLANIGGKVAFYQVEDDEDNRPNVGAYRCYLTTPANARALYFPESEATAIDAISALTSGEAQIFNAAGAQLPSLQKGMNILQLSNGKSIKVMVK